MDIALNNCGLVPGPVQSLVVNKEHEEAGKGHKGNEQLSLAIVSHVRALHYSTPGVCSKIEECMGVSSNGEPQKWLRASVWCLLKPPQKGYQLQNGKTFKGNGLPKSVSMNTDVSFPQVPWVKEPKELPHSVGVRFGMVLVCFIKMISR